MTTSEHTLTDPRPAFAAAAATAVATVAGVRPDQLSGPTPCTEYDLRALLGHLVSVLRRVAAVGRGEPPFSVPQVTTDVPDEGWGPGRPRGRRRGPRRLGRRRGARPRARAALRPAPRRGRDGHLHR